MSEQVKIARQVGVAKALHEQGYSFDGIKLAFVHLGIEEDVADSIVKEAALPKGLLNLVNKIIPYLRKGQQSASKWRTLTGPDAGFWRPQLGAWGVRGTRGARKALEALRQDPSKALGGGAMNFGRGLLFGGKGIGGSLGRGTSGTLLGATVLGD